MTRCARWDRADPCLRWELSYLADTAGSTEDGDLVAALLLSSELKDEKWVRAPPYKPPSAYIRPLVGRGSRQVYVSLVSGIALHGRCPRRATTQTACVRGLAGLDRAELKWGITDRARGALLRRAESMLAVK